MDTAGTMSAYDAGTGTSLWSVKLPLQYLFSSPPIAAGGVVYTGGSGTGGTVYAVDQTTGSVLATQEVLSADISSPALSTGGVFVSYGCNQAYAFAQTTLSLRWHYSTSCESGGGKTAVLESGRMFTRDYLGNLILDAATGSLVGSYGPTAVLPVVAAPAVRNNTMWLLSGGALSAVDVTVPSSPTTLWSFVGDGQLVTAPIVLSTPAGDFVFEGSSSGLLYAVDAATGDVVWSTDVGAAMERPDEQNLTQPLTGLGAGQGLLIVPAGNTISAYSGSGPPAPASTPVPTSSAGARGLLAAIVCLFAIHEIRRRRSRPSRG